MLIRQQINSTVKKQAGISLIEVMVSVFVFSVGALGLAAMQATALVTSGDTKQRSLVIWKAQELVDRMRATKNSTDPDGLLATYQDTISDFGGKSDSADIGKDTQSNTISCPAAAPTRCAAYTDSSGSYHTAAVCTTDEVVAFDLWEVLCETNSGLSPQAIAGAESDTGVVGVSNLEVALVQNVDEYYLYFEWLSRSADSNAGLEQKTTTVKTNLCGIDVDLDTSLDAYCVIVR